ncbi:MAG: CHAT domain-containing tetratricopeptide repeat protein [Blastocatellia bacterium]
MRFPLRLLILLWLVGAVWAQPDAPTEKAGKLAAQFVAVGTDAERAALWAAHSEALTPALAQAFLALGREAAKRYDYSQALRCFQLAERVADRNNDRKATAQALHNQGTILSNLGDYESAVLCYQKSLVLKDVADKAGRAVTLTNLGNAYVELGDYETSQLHLRQALALREALGDKNGQANVLGNLGNLSFHQSNFRQTLMFYQQALQLRDPADYDWVCGYLNNIGNIYRHQGDYPLALDYFQRALTAAQAAQDQHLQAMILNNTGTAYWGQGKYDQAEAFFQKSQSFRRADDYVGQSAVLINLGAIAQARHNLAGAEKAYQQSLELRERLNIPWLIAEACINLSSAIHRQGRAPESLPLAERALQQARKSNNIEMLWHANSNLGQIYRTLNRPAESRAAFEAAIQIIETMRETISGDDNAQELFFEDKVEPYYQLVELLLSDKQPAAALAQAERAKARVLLDVLQNGRTTIAKAMSAAEKEQETALQREVVALNLQLHKENLRQAADAARLTVLRDRLEQARTRQAAFQATLYAAHPELQVQRGQTPVFNLSAIANSLLVRGTALLEYVVAEEKTILFVLTGGATKPDLRAYEIPLGRDEIKQQVESFRQQLAAHELAFAPTATRLYSQLLAPAAAQLRGATNLVIVRDAGLWELPFQALKNEAGRYLLADFALSYAPSLTALAEMTKLQQTRQKVAPKVLAFGNPAFATTGQTAEQLKAGFTPLPSSAVEVQQLTKLYGPAQSKVYIGAAASEERVKAEAGSASILHLATHGVLNDANPLYSQIVLAQPDANSKEDGLLEAWEVMQLNLRAQVVVLSACETGRGRIGAGEGVIGLTWAFFVAGAPSTVVSQWKVDAASTSELMQEFHRRLQLRNGTTKAEALRAAALRLMQNPKYRHPFFWASFSLLGEGQ